MVTVSDTVDITDVEMKWRDLETRASPSFFQTWTWIGCLFESRFPDPVFIEAKEGSKTVALALFNRRGGRFHLGENGDPALDSPYVEFNGVLAETGRESDLSLACFTAISLNARRIGGSRAKRITMNGVDQQTIVPIANAFYFEAKTSRHAPFARLSAEADRYLEDRSANTRQQLRRSNRHYSGIGALKLCRAETADQARAFLTDLAILHQQTWTMRGMRGAFALPVFFRFHHELIMRGLPRREIDLLRVSAGTRLIGLLYNFRYRGRVFAYQSGFDYTSGGRQAKPGLTCHHQAICFSIMTGAYRYDFLAGEDRYKLSLSDDTDTLNWISGIQFRRRGVPTAG